MLKLPNGAFLLTEVSELPKWPKAKELFLDVETCRIFKARIIDDSDGEETDYSGLYPHGGDRIAGFSATVDDDPFCIYVPVRHTMGKNLPLAPVVAWLDDILGRVEYWVNHNIILDATFIVYEGVEHTAYPKLVDTLTRAKMHDSDRMGHGLKQVVPDWGGPAMAEEQRIKSYLKSIKSKSYGDVPADLMGHYATDDVLGNRWLHRHLQTNMAEQVQRVLQTETLLTPVLYDMEMRGLQLDRRECQVALAKGLQRMIELQLDITDTAGREFTNSSTCLYDIFTQRMGLPVLVTKWEKDDETKRYIDTGRPTYDKDALGVYRAHPQVQAEPKLAQLVEDVLEYRKLAQLTGLFYKPFLELMDGNFRIHPTYNQLVRTGRMSCKRPNAQQQTKASKRLIKPGPERCFISCDYSQIEFRLIIHYIEDESAIKAYRENPWTDFHQWVAEMIGIKRDPAKTINFGMGYGAGKKKVTSELASDEDIIFEVGQEINAMVERAEITPAQRHEVFVEMCVRKADTVYNTYHETFPTLKSTAREATAACKRRGYVFNAYGRQRHIAMERAHIAFNTVIQGGAMDLIKEAMVRLAYRYNQKMRDWDIHLLANVHDELLFDAPIELMLNSEVHEYITTQMELTTVPFLVPIKTGLGVSPNNWAEAGGKAQVKDTQGNILAGRIIPPQA